HVPRKRAWAAVCMERRHYGRRPCVRSWRRWTRTVCLSVPVLMAACGAPNGSPPSRPESPSAVVEPADPTPAGTERPVLYVAPPSTPTEAGALSGFDIDPATGGLTAMPGTPYALPLTERPHEVAVDPSGRFVYLSTHPRADTSLAGGLFA